MLITAESTVADIATHAPATIPVFQRHQIDFCCGGKSPLASVCAERHIDAAALVAELEAAAAPQGDGPSWADATLTALVAHIQRRYHEHLRQELPRLEAMVAKVVSRHGDDMPDVLLAAAADLPRPAARPARSHAPRGRGAVPVHRGARGRTAPVEPTGRGMDQRAHRRHGGRPRTGRRRAGRPCVASPAAMRPPTGPARPSAASTTDLQNSKRTCTCTSTSRTTSSFREPRNWPQLSVAVARRACKLDTLQSIFRWPTASSPNRGVDLQGRRLRCLAGSNAVTP